MSRKSKIRWRESDLKELQRVINNYNNKIYRTKKNHPELVDVLPQRMTKKEAVAAIETRADFKRLTASLQRFSKRGAEKAVTSKRGAKSTEWAVDEFKRKQRLENSRRKREREKIESKEVKIAGKGQGRTRAEMGSIKENSLKPSKKKFENMSQKEWDLARKNMDRLLNATEREKKRQEMRENYLKGLTENGFLDDCPELENFIRGVDIDTFYETVQTDETATFFFYKDPIAYRTRLDTLVDTWQAAYEGANTKGAK